VKDKENRRLWGSWGEGKIFLEICTFGEFALSVPRRVERCLDGSRCAWGGKTMAVVLANDVLERRWLSIEASAYRSSLSQETIKRWVRRGLLTPHKAGRRTLIDVRELDQVITKGVD
jgi:hypothetical protein